MSNKPRQCVLCAKELSARDVFCPDCGFSQQERMLVDWEIRKLIERDIIIVDPILKLEEQLGPVSLDLRLDGFFREFRYMEKGVIDITEMVHEHEYYNFKDLEIDKGKCYYLQPGKMVLGQSFEYVKLPNFIVAELGGRSSIAKLGIEVHATSNQVAPGFSGHITFELKNPGSMGVKLQPLGRIATLTFHLTQKVQAPYKGKFQNQLRIKPPKPDNDLVKLKEFFQQKNAIP